ncbi:DUF4340 domain-containing protein [Sulfuriflexus sp.]|uniref:DUF4340 domain-containing protein n=1 Tax=Sulfuriflexus sp. TaxID=2015443 RepID=UPI0028CDA2A1|nr:DUF4340 domain-containing protein [Sulfuriflexus sp.]MDT8405199.1 DUF4340 domain-containing protein [Sulfuriflexus sp.]
MSRNLLNLGLFVAVLLLAALVMWAPGEQPANLSELSSLAPGDIRRIQIQRDALQDVELEKQDGHWQMLSPYRVAADKTRVGALLRLINTTSHVRFPASGRELADYGLETVLAQVKFDNQLFQFGDLEPISKRRYVLLENEIHLVTDLFYHQLRTSATQFVSPRLLTDAQRIRRLRLPDREYELKQDGSWLLTPAVDAVSADQLNTFISNWQRLRANRVSAAAADDSEERIHIELADGNELVFEVLRPDDEVVFVRRDLGLQYHVARQMAEPLFSLPKPAALEKY